SAFCSNVHSNRILRNSTQQRIDLQHQLHTFSLSLNTLSLDPKQITLCKSSGHFFSENSTPVLVSSTPSKSCLVIVTSNYWSRIEQQTRFSFHLKFLHRSKVPFEFVEIDLYVCEI